MIVDGQAPASQAMSSAGNGAAPSGQGAWQREMERAMQEWFRHAPVVSHLPALPVAPLMPLMPAGRDDSEGVPNETASDGSEATFRADEPQEHGLAAASGNTPRSTSAGADAPSHAKPDTGHPASTTQGTSQAAANVQGQVALQAPPSARAPVASSSPALLRASLSVAARAEEAAAPGSAALGPDVVVGSTSFVVTGNRTENVAQLGNSIRNWLAAPTAAPSTEPVGPTAGGDAMPEQPEAPAARARTASSDAKADKVLDQAQRTRPADVQQSGVIAPPVRLHAEWSGSEVRLWLGADASEQAQVQGMLPQLMRWVAGQGWSVQSVICNGRTLYTASNAAVRLLPDVQDTNTDGEETVWR